MAAIPKRHSDTICWKKRDKREVDKLMSKKVVSEEESYFVTEEDIRREHRKSGTYKENNKNIRR